MDILFQKESLISVLTVLSAAIVGFILLSPRVARAERWRATVTPLASIIGSGFLVLGPILLHEYGSLAPLAMAALCSIAYLFGAAIRSNIKHLEPLAAEGKAPKLVAHFERVSSWVLAAAYITSVAYYLNLLGAFSVSLTPANDPFSARLITTGFLVFIGFYGLRHGLAKLEVLEQGAVTAKLAIIAGLLVALGLYSFGKWRDDTVVSNSANNLNAHSIFVAFGLIVTVQGFETSRYLGKAHSAAMRIQTMKLAQWTSTAIYIAYVLALTWAFKANSVGQGETAIIGVTSVVAPVLPIMLVAAALAAQFSAAVADTAGCGGLVEELSKGRVISKVGYLIVSFAGLLLTWTANIFEIIAYASRAFAVYYTLQSVIASIMAWQRGSRLAATGFAILAGLGGAIAILGVAVE